MKKEDVVQNNNLFKNMHQDIYDSLYLFTCINYTQIRNKIKKIMRGILSHKVNKKKESRTLK